MADRSGALITVEEARARLLQAVCPTAAQAVVLGEASGQHLALPVSSPHDHPLFDMSAVDGYAFASGDGPGPLRVVRSLAAGDVSPHALGAGECARIFTGAMVPAGADTVVMQEHVERSGDHVRINGAMPRAGANVRRKGEQVRAGDVLLEAGARLGAAEVGLLASAGVHTVKVHGRPAVGIVRTGGEFADTPDPAPGRIFSSNELMLAAAVKAQQLDASGPVHTPADERDELRHALALCMQASDVVITTGGVSVGEHDLVRSVVEELGAEIRFHGVGQKPGKPMLFATLGNKAVFGLPGNPRAVLVAWHLYVLPFLRAMQGMVHPWPTTGKLSLAQAVRWKGGRTEFRAGLLRDGQVELLPDEGSHMLVGMTVADVLVELPPEGGELPQGAVVRVHHLCRA